MFSSFIDFPKFLDPSCYGQRNIYDVNGNYLKTLCLYNQSATNEQAGVVCKSFGMKLANPDDGPEILGNLLTRANVEFSYFNGAALWTGGQKNNLCSALSWKSSWNFERIWTDCNKFLWSYCEFGGINLTFSLQFEKC